MAGVYTVWGSNDPIEWTHLNLTTPERDAAYGEAQRMVDSGRYQFVAIDLDGRTIWSNDPDTPAG